MVSFSVITNILFFSSIAIILLKIVFWNDNVILRLDVRFLLICLLLIVLRLLVPIESPIVNRIPISKVYPDLYRLLRSSTFFWMDIQLNVLTLLKVGWAAGAIVSTTIRTFSYYLTVKRVRGYRELKNPEYNEEVERINREFGRNKKFRLMISKETETAYIFGVIKPYIVIPKGEEFTPQEIYFILKHEMLHFYRGDMLVRIMCEIIKAVYWWNPLIYVLGELVVDMQEINVDFNVVRKLPKLESLQYSDCLIRAARGEEKRQKKERWEIGFRKKSPSAIHKRIELMIKNLKINGRKTAASLLLSVLILCLITMCPSIFIFEPYSRVEEDTEGTIGIREGNIYYVVNEDGTYDIYIDGQYYKTVLEVFDDDIKIYNSLTEVEGND